MTDATSNPAAFTEGLIAAQKAGSRFAPRHWPESRAAALAVQAAVLEALGTTAGGFKVGNTASDEPILAPIRADRVLESGASFPVADHIGVELEVGLEVLAPIPADVTAATIAQYLRPRPVIELVDTRLTGDAAEAPLAKLADNQINAGLILGAPLEDWDGSDFTTVPAALACGTETLLDGGEVTVPGGSALFNAAALARAIGSHCGGLRPGQVIITGSLNPLTYFGPGTEVQGRIDGLGEVAVSLG